MLCLVSLLFLCRWTKNQKGVGSNVVVLKERVIKLPALTRGQWHHLVISCRQTKLRAETKSESEENLQSSEVCIVDVPGDFFLKVPRTFFSARKASCQTTIRLLRKAGLLT